MWTAEASQEDDTVTISVGSHIGAAVLLTAVILVAVLLLATAVGDALVGAEYESYDEHLVVAGDTLWEIAEAYTPAGGDVRTTIFGIREASGLEGSVIVPGQVLRIPLSG
jgi:nucleoid-associated protein YgaU